MRHKRLAAGVEYNIELLSEDAINYHYDMLHRLDHVSMTPIDRLYARVEQDRTVALGIFRAEGCLRVHATEDSWKLIKGGKYVL